MRCELATQSVFLLNRQIEGQGIVGNLQTKIVKLFPSNKPNGEPRAIVMSVLYTCTAHHVCVKLPCERLKTKMIQMS